MQYFIDFDYIVLGSFVMQDLNRVKLYTTVVGILKNIDELKDGYFSELIDIINININILEDIENKFFKDSNELQFSVDDLKTRLKHNIKIIPDYINYGENHSYIKDVVNELNVFLEKQYDDEFYAFNNLIKLLNKNNNEAIKRAYNPEDILEIIEDKRIREKCIENSSYKNRNKVFLSHAFDDKLYTFSLYIYMCMHGIFLYVDWMWTSQLKDGKLIKNNLSKHLMESSQLLFLRTINSEFNIRGNGNIRGWCSWELGNFYGVNEINKHEKYYIELYRKKSKQLPNHQLDGVNPLNGVKSCRLF